MKNTIIFVAILVLLNASTSAFWDDDREYAPGPTFVHSVGTLGPYERIETLDFSQSFPFLEWLILEPVYSIATKKDLENTIDDMGLSNNLKLKRMNVNGEIFGKILSLAYLPNLNKLDISSSAIDINFSRLPNLKEIHLEYCNFTYETLENLTQLPYLEKLTFKTFADIGMEHFNDDIIELFGQCQNLKVLHISTKSANAGYIKQRLKTALPDADIRVGWGRNY